MSRVWIVEAEHFNVPGRVLKVFATQGSAIVEAIELTNIMLKDAREHARDTDAPDVATVATWEVKVEELQNEYGAQYCYVEVNEHEVAA